jgi:hypothetical protein
MADMICHKVYELLMSILKISKTIGIVSRLRHFVPINTLLNIYRSLISPYLRFGIALWGQATNIHMVKLLKLQKRVLRLIYFSDYTTHPVPKDGIVLKVNVDH